MSRFRTMRDWLSRFRKVHEHKDRANLEAFIRSLRPETPSSPLIRCGVSADGGYLLPDDFSGVAACVSPGVAGECGFDLDMAGRGLEVYMTDASVDGPPVANPKFHFSKLFLDAYNSETTVRIDDFCQNICDGRDLVLQMDEDCIFWIYSDPQGSRVHVLAARPSGVFKVANQTSSSA